MGLAQPVTNSHTPAMRHRVVAAHDGSTIARLGDIVTVTGPRGAIGENGCAPIEMSFVVDSIVGPGGKRSWRD